MERNMESGAPDVERTAQDALMDMACSSEFSEGCIVPTVDAVYGGGAQ